MEWEVVIGLEIHVQLNTKTKIFSAAATAYGAQPNTQACAVDLDNDGDVPTKDVGFQSPAAIRLEGAGDRDSVHSLHTFRIKGLVGLVEGVLRVRVTSPAQRGRANRALVELLAARLGVPRGRIHILRGHASRDKVIAIEGLSQEEALHRLLSG